MFSKTIIDSDMFLDLSVTSQNLYFHLAMRADDDGFINSPKKIMRMVGSSQKDIEQLIQEQFLIPFESGVVVIKHWKVHNYIRSDRKQETFHKLEKQQLFIENNIYTLEKKGLNCLTHDSQVVYQSMTQDRLGKDRLGKDKKDNSIPYSEIEELFHNTCTKISKIKKLSDTRKKKLSTWYKETNSLEEIKEVFKRVNESKFLTGNNDRQWKADFDWIIKPENRLKILEGKYNEKESQPTQQKNNYRDGYISDFDPNMF